MQNNDQIMHRLGIVEHDIANIKLRLDTLTRIEDKLEQVDQKIDDMKMVIAAQELAATKREADIITSQNKLQIKVLTSVLSVIVAIFSSLVVGYATHFLR